VNVIRVAVAQTETNLQYRAENVVQAIGYIEQAAALGAHLVCLPETYPGPWTTPVDYDAMPALCQAAQKYNLYVAAGLIEPVPDKPDWYYTSHVLIDAHGEIMGTYRRTTPTGPWLYRGSFFWDFNWQEADDFPVFETQWGKVGLAICSEVYMPEVCRALALQGAEIILLPAGVPKGPLWETWRTLIFARAIENLCFTATCQNIFAPSDLGLAMICSPEKIMVESTATGVFVADCDLDRLRLLRETEDSWDFPGVKYCKPGIFKQWYRPELHAHVPAEIRTITSNQAAEA
jgi:predicted amidohydrolase